jgi:hypothetical protein
MTYVISRKSIAAVMFRLGVAATLVNLSLLWLAGMLASPPNTFLLVLTATSTASLATVAGPIALFAVPRLVLKLTCEGLSCGNSARSWEEIDLRTPRTGAGGTSLTFSGPNSPRFVVLTRFYGVSLWTVSERPSSSGPD